MMKSKLSTQQAQTSDSFLFKHLFQIFRRFFTNLKPSVVCCPVQRWQLGARCVSLLGWRW